MKVLKMVAVAVVADGRAHGVHVDNHLLEAGPHLEVGRHPGVDPGRVHVDRLVVGGLHQEEGPGPDLADPHLVEDSPLLVAVPHRVADRQIEEMVADRLIEVGRGVDIRKLGRKKAEADVVKRLRSAAVEHNEAMMFERRAVPQEIPRI